MTCFLAPTAAVIITTAIRKKINPKYHLDWLIKMFWGGVIVLVIEHIYHGEITSGYILEEIVTVGIAMTIAVIIVWAMMVAFIKQYKFSFISLMVSGAIIMVLVDQALNR